MIVVLKTSASTHLTSFVFESALAKELSGRQQNSVCSVIRLATFNERIVLEAQSTTLHKPISRLAKGRIEGIFAGNVSITSSPHHRTDIAALSLSVYPFRLKCNCPLLRSPMRLTWLKLRARPAQMKLLHASGVTTITTSDYITKARKSLRDAVRLLMSRRH